MPNWWLVEQLDVERLLATWLWLCPIRLALIARNAFGDLFLQDDAGNIFRLDVGVSEFTEIADSSAQFAELASRAENLEGWFAESDERTAAAQGLMPGRATNA